MKNRLILFCFIMISVSCKTPEKEIIQPAETLGGAYKGKVIIVSIIPAKMENGRESSEYCEIYFKFIPEKTEGTVGLDSSASEEEMIKLQYDNSTSFHKNWIEKWGIRTGNEYQGTRIKGKGKVTGIHVRYEVDLRPAE